MLGRSPLIRSARRRAALIATAIALPVAVIFGLVTAQLTAERVVPVPEPPGSAATRQVCAQLTASLPRRLDRLKARQVAGDPQVTAAWGDPPVTLQCGLIPAPAPLGQVLTLDGVRWAPVTGPDGVTWTSLGRRATVQVRVPKEYDNQAPLLAQLSPYLIRRLPEQS